MVTVAVPLEVAEAAMERSSCEDSFGFNEVLVVIAVVATARVVKMNAQAPTIFVLVFLETKLAGVLVALAVPKAAAVRLARSAAQQVSYRKHVVALFPVCDGSGLFLLRLNGNVKREGFSKRDRKRSSHTHAGSDNLLQAQDLSSAFVSTCLICVISFFLKLLHVDLWGQ